MSRDDISLIAQRSSDFMDPASLLNAGQANGPLLQGISSSRALRQAVWADNTWRQSPYVPNDAPTDEATSPMSNRDMFVQYVAKTLCFQCGVSTPAFKTAVGLLCDECGAWSGYLTWLQAAETGYPLELHTDTRHMAYKVGFESIEWPLHSLALEYIELADSRHDSRPENSNIGERYIPNQPDFPRVHTYPVILRLLGWLTANAPTVLLGDIFTSLYVYKKLTNSLGVNRYWTTETIREPGFTGFDGSWTDGEEGEEIENTWFDSDYASNMVLFDSIHVAYELCKVYGYTDKLLADDGYGQYIFKWLLEDSRVENGVPGSLFRGAPVRRSVGNGLSQL